MARRAVAVACVTLLSSGCGAPPPSENMNAVASISTNDWTRHATSGFSFETPSEWRDAGSHPAFLKLEGARSADDAEHVTIAAAFVTPNVDLDSDAAAWRAYFRIAHGAGACSFEETRDVLGGEPALRLHVECATSRAPSDFTIVAIMHENKVFDVSCGGDGDVSACAAVVESFRFTKQ